MTPRIGSLFSGAGGLDIAVEHVTGGRTIWQAEIDPAASLVLTSHWPDVPNFGDVSEVNWDALRFHIDDVIGVSFKPDIVTLGFPCQDVSAAGLRKGMGTGTRSGLWAKAVRCLTALRPPTVVVENVKGLLSIDAGEGRKGVDVVIADLEALGYGVAWTVASAASIGAPHRRERVFILAQTGVASRGRITAPTALNALLLLPTPRARDHKGRAAPNRAGGDNLPGVVEKLLPTPCSRDATVSVPGRNGGDALPDITRKIVADQYALLPTPQARDGHGPKTVAQIQRGRANGGVANLKEYAVHFLPWPGWGEYAPAVANWETVSETAAPCPVEPNTTGGLRLACEFSEWMMGWPAGWVTALMNKNPRKRVAGRFGYTAAMRVIGNGVVAHQAAAALELLGIHGGVDVDYPSLVG